MTQPYITHCMFCPHYSLLRGVRRRHQENRQPSKWSPVRLTLGSPFTAGLAYIDSNNTPPFNIIVDQLSAQYGRILA
jgi:hypothetical protein